MAFEISKNNRQSHYKVEKAYINQPDETLLPVDPLAMRLDAIKDGPINQLSFQNNKLGLDETCP